MPNIADKIKDLQNAIPQGETRYITVSELRADEGGKFVEGYAAVFGQFSLDLGGFREKIKKGAFTKTIQEGDVRALWNHEDKYVLGRTSAGTLTLSEDERGLKVRIECPNTTWANDLKESIKRKDVKEMSFGFNTIKDTWTYNNDTDEVERELLEVRLWEVSIVTFPAYPQTDVSVRAVAFAAEKAEGKLFKALLRLSTAAATPEDLKLIRDYANELRAKTEPKDEPAPATPPAPEPPPHSPVDTDTLRKNLDLLELSIN